MEKRIINVLVIEDDKDEVARIQSYFELCPDMEFAGATGTSDEGIAMTKELHPDAVVLDLELEEGDGLYYLNAWRAGELRCDPVVLVLTNSHSSHTLEAAHKRGVDRIFQKWKDDYSNNGPRILVEYIRELAPDSSKRGKLSEADELKGDIECALVRLGDRLKIPMGSKTLAYLAEGAASLTEDVEANLRDLATLRKDETREQEREATRTLEVHTRIPALDRELRRLALEADEHGIFVECFVREDLSELLKENILSETDLLQIFDNLLRNAIKSIVRGDPPRRIISIYIKNENDAACIRVSDSGDDFDPSVLENLGAAKNTTDGQGFGLVNILEALAKCTASFFINQYPKRAMGHKKDVTILFDGAGMLDIVLPYQERQRITIEEALKREIKKEESLYVPNR